MRGRGVGQGKMVKQERGGHVDEHANQVLVACACDSMNSVATQHVVGGVGAGH